jgi:hypothetical protein
MVKSIEFQVGVDLLLGDYPAANVPASMREYAEKLADLLAEEWPEADIDWELDLHTGFSTSVNLEVDGDTDHDRVRERIRQISDEVYGRHEWWVVID